MFHFPLTLMNRLNQTETTVFQLCRFAIFSKDPLFRLLYYTNQRRESRIKNILNQYKMTSPFSIQFSTKATASSFKLNGMGLRNKTLFNYAKHEFLSMFSV